MHVWFQQAHRRRSIKDNIHVWKGIKTGVEEAGTRARARFCRIVHVVFLYLRAWRDSADKSICPLTCFASLPDSNVPSWFLAQSPSAKVVQTVSWGLDAQFGVVLLTVAYLRHFQPCAFKTCPDFYTRSFTRSFFAAPGVLQAESGVCLESLWHAKVLRVNIWTISLWSMSYLSFLCKLAVLVGRAFSNALEKNMVVGKWSRDLP